MNEHDAFLLSIGENIYDDMPRLVFADWLEEHGETERAELIRTQCELEPIRDIFESKRSAELHERENQLLWDHQKTWLGKGMEDWAHWRKDGASAEFRRGFVDTVSMPVRTFLTQGANARRRHPTIRRVVLHRINGNGERLANCEALEGLAELELACWYSDADAKAIAASPHLTRLHVLDLWLGRRSPLSDGKLCRLMAESKAWPNLRQIGLLNPTDEKHPSKKRLTTVVNKAVGKRIAVYHRGWPEHFPFAEDYWYLFPGYLADGRMALASEDASTTPPTFCIITFDKKGKQTQEVLTVPFPNDLAAIPPNDWYNHKKQMKQHLIDSIGFRPGFIRIQDCQFPCDDSGYNSPFWSICTFQGDEQLLGAPDSDEEPTYW